MRVTKLIKEYVEETVKAIYQPRIDEIGAEYRVREKAVDEKIQAVIKEANEKMAKILTDANFTLKYDKKEVITSWSSYEDYETLKEDVDKRRALINERNAKIKDILVNLELGATRAELDEMIANLKQEA